MAHSAFEALHAIHSALSARGFFSQFVGSMIQYRHPQRPEWSVGLSVDENPWRAAVRHGEFRFQLTNTTFVPQADLQEEAQALLNNLQEEGLALHGDFDVGDLDASIAPDAVHTMKAACRQGSGMHEAFKIYLKAIHDSLKEKEGGRKEKKKQKNKVAASPVRRKK